VNRTQAAGLALATVLLAPAVGTAQSLERRVLATKHGTVRLSYATKPGVCGNGDRGISLRNDRKDDWQPSCEAGAAHVALRMEDGELVEVTARVGGRWLPQDGVTDLGTVPARDAAQLFLSLARRDGPGAEDAIFPAIIADSTTDLWRELVTIARNGKLRSDVRKSALFWVGQEAAAAATRDLADVVGDDAIEREVRETAVFALSQRPREEAVPALLQVARTSRDPKLRRSAIFWLGQTDDARALAYFEDVLAKP
jgi:hypothetical protein